jgi:putative acetyltransferase
MATYLLRRIIQFHFKIGDNVLNSRWNSRKAMYRHGLIGMSNAVQPESMKTVFDIRADDLGGPEITELLHEHLRCLALITPPESRHALNLDGLCRPDVTFWSIWSGSELAGCGALKELTRAHGEIKSMRTAYSHQRKGVASQMVRHLIDESKRRGYRRLSLETGAMDYFEPARRLYASLGFMKCGPFGTYIEDPNSVFMTQEF